MDATAHNRYFAHDPRFNRDAYLNDLNFDVSGLPLSADPREFGPGGDDSDSGNDSDEDSLASFLGPLMGIDNLAISSRAPGDSSITDPDADAPAVGPLPLSPPSQYSALSSPHVQPITTTAALPELPFPIRRPGACGRRCEPAGIDEDAPVKRAFFGAPGFSFLDPSTALYPYYEAFTGRARTSTARDEPSANAQTHANANANANVDDADALNEGFASLSLASRTSPSTRRARLSAGGAAPYTARRTHTHTHTQTQREAEDLEATTPWVRCRWAGCGALIRRDAAAAAVHMRLHLPGGPWPWKPRSAKADACRWYGCGERHDAQCGEMLGHVLMGHMRLGYACGHWDSRAGKESEGSGRWW